MSTQPGNDVAPQWAHGPRYIIAPVAVLADDRLSPIDLRIFLALCHRTDNVTGKAWPSYATMAADAFVSRASAIRAVKHLIECGWVSAETRRREDGSARSTLYTVNYDHRLARVPESATVTDGEDDDTEGGLNLIPPPQANPDTTQSHSSDTTQSQAADTRGGVTAVIPERLRRTNNPSPTAGARDSEIRQLLDPRAHDAFDAFVAAETRRGTTADVLALVNEPITGGPRYTWPEISAALIELRGNEHLSGFNAPLLRGVCRRVRGANAVSADALPTKRVGPTAIDRAQQLWSLAMARGLAQPASAETLREQCDRAATDPRAVAAGCTTGAELFSLVSRLRLHEFSNRPAKDEHFTVRDIAGRLDRLERGAA